MLAKTENIVALFLIFRIIEALIYVYVLKIPYKKIKGGVYKVIEKREKEVSKLFSEKENIIRNVSLLVGFIAILLQIMEYPVYYNGSFRSVIIITGILLGLTLTGSRIYLNSKMKNQVSEIEKKNKQSEINNEERNKKNLKLRRSDSLFYMLDLCYWLSMGAALRNIIFFISMIVLIVLRRKEMNLNRERSYSRVTLNEMK